MTKFHINSKGVPAPCKAQKGNCPFGGPTGIENHFDTLEEAEEFAKKQNETKYGILPAEEFAEKQNEQSTNQAKKEFEKIKLAISKTKDKAKQEDLRTWLAIVNQDLNNGQDKREMELNELFEGLNEPDGGATISFSDTKIISPITGFCASPFPEYSKVYEKAEDVTFDSLLDYIDNVNETSENILEEEDTYLGLWHDPDTGKVYLDISKRYATAKDARVACENHDQIAYFDLQLFESVEVDRNATSGQKDKEKVLA